MNKKDFLKKLVSDSYSSIADDFDVTRQAAWPELFNLTKLVKQGDKVLDLGCGNGRLLKALPPVNFYYQGYDANDFLINQARQSFLNQQFDKVELPNFPVKENYYNQVFMIATFHHLADKKDRLRLLRNIYQSLQPGGILVMTNWNLWQRKYLKYLFTAISQKLAWNDFFIPWKSQGRETQRYYHGFTRMELKRLLKKVGFKSIKIWSPGYNYQITAKK